MRCQNCGNEMADGAKFCPKCGEKLGDMVEQDRVEEHVDDTQATETTQKNVNASGTQGNKFVWKQQYTYIIFVVAIIIAVAAGLAVRASKNNQKDDYSTENADITTVKSEKASEDISITEEESESEIEESISETEKSMTESEMDTDTESEVAAEEYSYDESFYGIWCYASKDYNEVLREGDQLEQNCGISSAIVVSSDWKNLNSETWYCLSAGRYESEESAKEYIDNIQEYYPDAYIKYTGEYKKADTGEDSSNVVVMYTNTPGVNLRSESKHKSDLVITLPADKTILYYDGTLGSGYGSDGQLHNWYYVTTEEGVSGWVRSDLVVVDQLVNVKP